MSLSNKNNRRKRKIKKALIYIIITLLALIMIYPLVWMIFASFKPSNEIFDNSHLLPRVWKFDNFVNGWKGVKSYSYLRFYMNTFLLVGGVILGNLFSSSVVGFGFARGRFKGKKFLFSLLMGTMMLPGTVTMIPNFIIFNSLGWVNTYLPFIVPAFCGGTFFVYLMIQFMKGISTELDEAARIDGCSSFQIFARIILPLCKPTLATVAVFSFVWTWDDFMGQLIYISEMKKYTVALALKIMVDPLAAIDWGAVIAMALLSVVPSIVVYFVAQDSFVEGIATTGLKG
ncbi:MAG: carbohydrate ABC transporter permease [Fusicatenibacter sp.]|nr:carbohydrate ABC transporter permease [Fusicatenibacter sp.]